MQRSTKKFLNFMFFVFSLAGFMVIFFADRLDTEIGIVIPVLLVFVYSMAAGGLIRGCSDHDTADHYLDSIYLLGFMFTLIALVAFFFRVYQDITAEEELSVLQSALYYIGISVTTTIAGVFFRNIMRGSYLKNHPLPQDNMEKSYELLQQIASGFSEKYSNTFGQIQVFLEERAESSKILAQNEKQYARTLSEFTESAGQFRNALDENRERINETLSGLVQSLSDQNGALTRIYNLTESFTDVSLRLREEAGNLPLEAVNQELFRLGNGVAELNAVLDGIIAVIEKKVEKV
ncbi:MAG: hypothetical protein ACLFSE_08465 [Spirochaetia bacterium]